MTAPRLDDDGLCICCSLDPRSCGKTLEALRRREALLERQRLLRLPGAASAAYAGSCGQCGEPYAVGTPIMGRRQAEGHRMALVRDGKPSWRSLECCEVQT